jgi:hypothetical protein
MVLFIQQEVCAHRVSMNNPCESTNFIPMTMPSTTVAVRVSLHFGSGRRLKRTKDRLADRRAPGGGDDWLRWNGWARAGGAEILAQ